MDPAAADSLQAVQDTLVIVQAQSTSWLEWASFAVSLLIAGFTGGYLWYTMGIFEKTEEQAGAAQESLVEQTRLNDAQIEAIEQERIERAHPLLWLDVETRNADSTKYVDFNLRNSSKQPSLDAYLLYFFRYNKNSSYWNQKRKHFQGVTESAKVLAKHGKFGYHISSEMEVLERNEKAKTIFQLPTLPDKSYCLLQYRDMHGENFARLFYYILQPDNEDENSEEYLTGRVTPYGVSVTSRYAWFRDSTDASKSELIMRKADGFNRDPEEDVPSYSDSEDSIGSKIDKLNHFLESSARIDQTEFVAMETRDRTSTKHWAVGPFDSA